MATFSKSTFDAASYLAFRPSYPRWLYDEVLTFHRNGLTSTSAGSSSPSTTPAPGPTRNNSIPQFRSAWDLGCGPGISSLPLLPHFSSVKGLEPSANMVSNALRLTSSTPSSLEVLPQALRSHFVDNQKLGRIAYVQGNAEELDQHCPPQSVDLIIAAQAAHWFTYDRLWPSLSRAIAPGGTLAFWCYAEFGLPDFPTHLTAPLISAFMTDPERMGNEAKQMIEDGQITNVGAYFEKPGRTILERGLVDVPWPWQLNKKDDPALERWDQTSATRTMYSVSSPNPEWPPINNASQAAGRVMDLVVTWEGLERYLRTASAVNNFLHQHPNDAAQHGGRDVVHRFVDRLKERIPRDTEKLRLQWPLSLMMIKAR
ncbi:hypothetical protein A4X09_0g3741 [Tilletia walkeri]|uniref:Methyltransferase type 11 domain-containing protein n=1 Tax=Tilletia walkeri TaxID=117179 RepID=A0A8X7NAT3_9BASI|nr:hypothetical protein A4X09_0g3741 [Tilletia walkeri]